MDPRISLINRLKLQLNGCVYVENRIKPGWRESLPFYLIKCPVHGYVESYPHGYDKKIICPMCLEELRLEHREKKETDALLIDESNEATRMLELKV